MDKELKRCFFLLKTYRYRINKQQYRTFKGQILAGDYRGFENGLFNLMKRKYINGTKN